MNNTECGNEYAVGFSANIIVNAESEADAIKIARQILDGTELVSIEIIDVVSI